MAEELEEDRPRRGDGSLPRVDLHGCTLDQARRRLAQELTRWRAGGATRGRVITGSGFGSPGGKARLAPEVDSWLRGEGRPTASPRSAPSSARARSTSPSSAEPARRSGVRSAS